MGFCLRDFLIKFLFCSVSTLSISLIVLLSFFNALFSSLFFNLFFIFSQVWSGKLRNGRNILSLNYANLTTFNCSIHDMNLILILKKELYYYRTCKRNVCTSSSGCWWKATEYFWVVTVPQPLHSPLRSVFSGVWKSSQLSRWSAQGPEEPS